MVYGYHIIVLRCRWLITPVIRSKISSLISQLCTGATRVVEIPFEQPVRLLRDYRGFHYRGSLNYFPRRCQLAYHSGAAVTFSDHSAKRRRYPGSTTLHSQSTVSRFPSACESLHGRSSKKCNTNCRKRRLREQHDPIIHKRSWTIAHSDSVQPTLTTSAADRQSSSDGVCSVDFSKSNKVANFSLAYSPSGNGCCEVLHRIVAQRLRAQPEPHNWVDALPKIILTMNTFIKQDIKMSAAMNAFNTNLRLPAQPLFDIFEKGTAFVDRTDREKPAETRQVRPGRDELGKVGNTKYVYLRERRLRHKLDPKYSGPFKVDRRHGTVVWIWRNGRLEPHKLDWVIAAGQLDLGDASERSSSDSDVALRSHEYFDTPGGTRDTEGSWPDVSRAGCPTVFYPDESRRESVSDPFFSQAGRRLRRPGRWDDFVMYYV